MSTVARGFHVGAGFRLLGYVPAKAPGSVSASQRVRWAVPVSRLRQANLPTRIFWSRRVVASQLRPCSAFTRKRSTTFLPTQLEPASFPNPQKKRSRRKVFDSQPCASCSPEPESRRRQKSETNVLLPGIPLFGNALDDPSGPGNGADSLLDGAWLEAFRPCGCWLENKCLCIVKAGPLMHLPWTRDEDEIFPEDDFPLGETVITCATHGDLAPYACCATGA